MCLRWGSILLQSIYHYYTYGHKIIQLMAVSICCLDETTQYLDSTPPLELTITKIVRGHTKSIAAQT